VPFDGPPTDRTAWFDTPTCAPVASEPAGATLAPEGRRGRTVESFHQMSDEELELLVNGEPRRVPANSTLGDLLALLAIGERRIAVAVNRDVVPRSTFETHRLCAGDRVEVLEAVGGG